MRGLIDSPGFVRRDRVFGAFELQKTEKSCQPGQKYNEVNPLILRQLDCRRSFCGAQGFTTYFRGGYLALVLLPTFRRREPVFGPPCFGRQPVDLRYKDGTTKTGALAILEVLTGHCRATAAL